MVESICTLIMGVVIAVTMVIMFFVMSKVDERNERMKRDRLEMFFEFLLEYGNNNVTIDEVSEFYDKVTKK